MDEIIRQYKESFALHGNSPNAVFWPKGRQDERFTALTRFISKDKFSILDFGCGLAHLRIYLEKNHPNKFEYTGADIVDDFVKENRKNFQNDKFILINTASEIAEQYDHIVSSGAFNMLYVNDVQEHKKIVFGILTELFSKTKVSLSVNFMTDAVDFIQPGAYHQNIKELYDFAFTKLSKRIVIDQSYMPYEFTITFFKDQTILRPENIYVNE